MSYEEQNNLEKPGYRDKYRFDNGLSPRICISYTTMHSHIARCELHMLSDGSTLLKD